MNTTATTAGRRPSRKIAKIVSLALVPLALVGSALIVSQASYSAYSATTVNPTSNWTTGTVALTDDDANTAAFTATNLKPGSTATKCIAVSSTGSLASTVKLYTTNPTTTKNLATHINLTITQGNGGSFGSCTGYTPLTSGSAVYTGTLADLGATNTTFATGLTSWATAGTTTSTPVETRTYQLTYTVSATAPDSTQGGTAGLGLTWEAQNS